MLSCPVCFQDYDMDDAAMSHHVAIHFDDPSTLVPVAPGANDFGRELGDKLSSDEQMGVPRGVGTTIGGTYTLGGGQVPAMRINPEPDEFSCMICGEPLGALGEEERGIHVNSCLDELNGELEFAKDNFMGEVDSGFAGPSNQAQATNGSRESRDSWYHPTMTVQSRTAIPANYSPNVIPILYQILLKACRAGTTRKAVLCEQGAVHIRGAWGFDSGYWWNPLGWGCGYRNFLMGLSSILSYYPSYKASFPFLDPVDAQADVAPGVRSLQRWMDEGWRSGFDPVGRTQLKNEIINTKKWIGTSDMCAVFSARGIPCRLYDFPRATGASWKSAKSTHTALVNFVIQYFDEDLADEGETKSASKNAFAAIMSSGGDPALRSINISRKMPIILQHAGHSRTIIGYEINREGSCNLLMFDPGKSMPKDIRNSAIEALLGEQPPNGAPPKFAHPQPPPLPRKRKKKPGPKPFESDSESGTCEIEVVSPEKAIATSISTNGKRRNDGPPSASAQSTKKTNRLEPDEQIDEDGWVTKKSQKPPPSGALEKQESGQRGKYGRKGGWKSFLEWERSPGKALGAFRVNLATLSRHSEYQILTFEGGPLMDQSAREARKTVTTTPIWQ